MRNIGNMVPAYGEMLGGVSAVIEFAVGILNVRHVVICGHSDCGAMKALLQPESVAGCRRVANWLTNARAALTVAQSLHTRASDEDDDLLSTLTEQNVLLQMQHLRTHPSVAGALALGELTAIRLDVRHRKRRGAHAADGKTAFTPVEPVAQMQMPDRREGS